MAKMTEVKPEQPRYSIEVSADEKEIIAKALLAYRNINYFCDQRSNKMVRDAFVGQTSHSGAILALSIIQAITSE
jgi:hypothetical protein